jgi:tetratricopeptide (TPR) repeat protein
VYLQQEQPPTGAKPRRAWRWLRAPLVGLALGLALVKGVQRWQISRLTAEERASAAHAHCERAQEISDEACQRLKVAPIYLPKDVMGDMIREYSRALDIDPNHLEALDGRAYWRWFRGDSDEALEDYNEFLRREPGNALVWYQRGRLRCERGDHKGAIEDFTRSLQIEPRRPGSAVLGARARCRRETGEWKGAIEDLVADGGYDHLSLGDCHQALQDHAAAVAEFSAYLKTSDAPNVRWRRGWSRFATGDRAGALDDFRFACASDCEMRRRAEDFILQKPLDPMTAVLKEALVLQPERGQ